MMILILTNILIQLIDSSIKSGLGIRHQHCLSICRVSVKKRDKFHKFIENFIKKSSHRAQHYKWTASAIFFMYLPGVTLFVAKVAFLSKLTGYCALFNLFVKDQLDVIVNVGSENVRSIINFNPRNQDVDFDMFDLFF